MSHHEQTGQEKKIQQALIKELESDFEGITISHLEKKGHAEYSGQFADGRKFVLKSVFFNPSEGKINYTFEMHFEKKICKEPVSASK